MFIACCALVLHSVCILSSATMAAVALSKKLRRGGGLSLLLLAVVLLVITQRPDFRCYTSYNKSAEQVVSSSSQSSPLSSDVNLTSFFDAMTIVRKEIKSKQRPSSSLALVQSYKVLHHTPYGRCLHLKDRACDTVAGDGDRHVHAAILTSFDTQMGAAKIDFSNMQAAPLCIDLGGNSGQFTLLMRAAGCRVDSYEPQSDMNWFHTGSLIANNWLGAPYGRMGGVKLIQGGASNQSGEIKLSFLWRPGGAPLSKPLTVKAYPIADIVQADIHMLKLDVDGPEALILDGLMPILKKEKPVITNMIAEITVSTFPQFGYNDQMMFDIFDAFYERGYTVYLVFSEEFQFYDQTVLQKCRLLKDWRFFDALYEVPRTAMPEVLIMNVTRDNKIVRKTKNFFFTLDPELQQAKPF